MGIGNHRFDAITLEEYFISPGAPVVVEQQENHANERVIVTEKPHWSSDSACKGLNRQYFYANPEGESTTEKNIRIAAAKAICGICSVVEPCLDEAIENGEYGVWGGTTERERRRIKRSRIAI